MGRYKFLEKCFGDYKTIALSNDNDATEFEIALQGATPLSFKINLNGNLFDILDGFATPEELKSARGARNWIMIPFANRIPGGIYKVNNFVYKLDPAPPRLDVIHGFTSHENFSVKNISTTETFIEASLSLNKIRPGVFKGYPFSLDVEVKYKLESEKLTVQVIAENTGTEPAPFSTGWHPYFKTSSNGIENLIFTVNAEGIILLDDKNIPLADEAAYGKVDNFPQLDFRSSIPKDKRKISGKILDNCFSNLLTENDGYSRASIYDPENGLKIALFQKGGVTLAFSGDTLAQRKRKSIAIEPMQFITNAFNRSELKEKILIKPGSNSVFEFGVEISK